MTWADYWQEPGALFTDRSEARAEGEEVARSVIATASLGPGARVLDVGAGYALGTPTYRAAGVAVTLCDQSRYFRAEARSTFPDVPHVPDLSAVDGPFDAIVVHSVLQYLDDGARQRLLTDAAALLRPGGVLLLGDVLPTARGPVGEALWTLARPGGRFGRVRRAVGLLRLIRSRYAAQARRQPLRRFADAEIAAELRAAGLEPRRLERNLGPAFGRRAWAGRLTRR